jgi:calcineurin-like phosphoesterase
VIGSNVETALERFLTTLPKRLSVADAPCMLNSVLVDVDGETGKASLIERINRTVN